MTIRITRNEAANCINFVGSTNPAYFNACLSAVINSDDPTKFDIINDIRSQNSPDIQYEFYAVRYLDFADKDGNVFTSAQEAVDYVNSNANVVGVSDTGTDLTGVAVNFRLDNTSTSVIMDNGSSFGVNTIQAVANADGTIHLHAVAGESPNTGNEAHIHKFFEKLEHTRVSVNGSGVAGGLNDVVNTLNELFTVGAFESVVISDPYSTMIADVSGTDAGFSLVGTGATDPAGDDIFTNTSTGNYAGLKSTATIDQAGEYFTFDIRGEGQIGFGLVHTQASYDGGYYSGNATYADPTTFAVSNSAHYGYQFSHWFHPTPNGSWTNYGASTGVVYGAGWYNWESQADWLAGNPVKIRCGIDTNGFISIESLQNDNATWVVHARSSYPVADGAEFHLGIKSANPAARVYSAPKVHLLSVDDTPTAIGDTNITLLGDAIGTLNGGIATASGTNLDNGFITEEGLSGSGEYFEFEVNLGSTHTVALVDADTHSIATIAADTATDLITPYVYFGQPINNLGAVTLTHDNWSGLPATQGNRFAATDFRIGFDNQGKLTVWSSTDGVNFIVSKHLSSAAVSGDYRLMYIGRDAGATFESISKGQLTAAPTMYFRYIESPDGNFEWPLFATEAEANYYDLNHGGTVGTGTSHTHTYADDPTNTTWYMADTGSTMTDTAAPSGITFAGATVTFTEITSLTDADLTPTAFSASDITQQEGTAVNAAVTPAGATWSTSVTISPSGSGLVYNSGSGLIQGTLTDVGSDTAYTVTVVRANSYGSSTGTMTITATDVAPVQTNDTSWTKALDFSGSNEHGKQVGSYYTVNPLRMNDYSTNIAPPTTAGYTSYGSSVRPWATAVVFQSKNANSNQHIWNQGEGAATGDDNIYLRVSSSGQLYFGWGREGSSKNECEIGSIGGISNSTHWWGVYIANNGTRLSSANATAANLADAFDIRLMGSNDTTAWGTLHDVGTEANWVTTGGRMDRSYTGDFTIGGRGSNRSFQGKVASMVVTTLRIGQPMPTDAEIETMITDPVAWLDDYKVGELFRPNYTAGDFGNFAIGTETCYRATQVWLMGDGTYDSYANGIRNQAGPEDQNNTKLQLNSMVSNDIQTVNITGLT